MKLKLYKLFTILLIVVLVVSIMVPASASASSPFHDVHSGHFFHEAVVWALESGITTGTTPTTFSPHNNVTRADFVTFLYRVANEPPVVDALLFPDVSNRNMHFFRAVNWANLNGIVTGFSDGTFRPFQHITREEIAVILLRFERTRFSNVVVNQNVMNQFSDGNTVSGFAREGVSWAIGRGILQGNAGRILPRENATRGESITMLHRYLTNGAAGTLEHGQMFNGVLIQGPATPTQNDAIVWNFFRSNGFSPVATAGIMGNLFAESGMRSDLTERSHHWRIVIDNNWPANLTPADINARYVQAVNDRTYRVGINNVRPEHRANFNPNNPRDNFTFDSLGFGISQWTWWTRKRDLYNFIESEQSRRGVPFNISDLTLQLEFFLRELNTSHSTVRNRLLTAQNVLESSNIVLLEFMRPAQMGISVQGRRAGYSLSYFNRFS